MRRHDDRRASLPEGSGDQAVDDGGADVRVYSRQGVVQERDGGGGVGGARERQPRLLAAGKCDAALADGGRVAGRQLGEVAAQLRGRDCRLVPAIALT